jgi:hypothetical protein
MLDQNKDGVITLEEFLLFCCSDETFLASVALLDNII